MSKKLKLLVVDDEVENLDLLYRTFRREFQVIKADSPLDALEILDGEAEVAVIISDQSMPEMSGVELFGKTTDRFPDTIRILLTGYTEDSLDEGAEAIEGARIFKCITKPFDTEELKAVVQQGVEVYQTARANN
ncbi:response regulator [Oxynema aestuarii AP17]|jgi:response regulator RpfG family c-di-GMP phosphodiesterase|uniref:Response regulator n=1 Tax=Oxynema aestuarii AP17 TaxID=2064643 RepID=A0A6H1U517_9CYAN|nr:response regulator [Oxynema aestuarii AP17]RMH70756.1 MAG: response regulator [Cyanobacteria bacterium J007]